MNEANQARNTSPTLQMTSALAPRRQITAVTSERAVVATYICQVGTSEKGLVHEQGRLPLGPKFHATELSLHRENHGSRLPHMLHSKQGLV